MKIKLRQKAGGRLMVLDENDQPIEGVVGVRVSGAAEAQAVVSVDIIEAEVAIDAERAAGEPPARGRVSARPSRQIAGAGDPVADEQSTNDAQKER